jgi:hypothetical protein
MKRVLIAALIQVAFCAFSFAEPPSGAPANNPQDTAALVQGKLAAARAVSRSSMATPACSYNFSSGAGDTALRCALEELPVLTIEAK